MRIGLLNWSRHDNIGDDAMTLAITQALEKRGHEVFNQSGDYRPDQVDAYIWGGGTLISKDGIYPVFKGDKPIIGFGIGVCEDPLPSYESIKDWLGYVRLIFARDYASYRILTSWGVPTMLSYDPVFLLKYSGEVKREYTAVNTFKSWKVDFNRVKDEIERFTDIKGFAVGKPEDPEGLKELGIPFEFYSDPEKLYQFLLGAHTAYTTRLHATVFAYMAEVPKIIPYLYDTKVRRFMEYVVDNKIPVNYMRQRLNADLDYALTML